MTVFPIVGRELRVAARKPNTYRIRFAFALGAAILLAWRVSDAASGWAPQTVIGRSVFTTLVILCFLYALFIGARTTADALSYEKREGTLGLLFLTDLRPFDVVFGKLVASSLNASYGLLAMIPLLAFPVLLGGVTGLQFLKAGIVLTNTLFFSLSVGLFVSSMSKNERSALFATMVTLASAALGPAVLAYYILDKFNFGIAEVVVGGAILMFSPIFGVFELLINFGPTRPPAWMFAANQLLLLLVTLITFRWTQRIVRNSWADRPPDARKAALIQQWQDFLHGSGLQRRSFRARLLDLNPFTWLVARERLKPTYAWAFVICSAIIWLIGRVRYGDVMTDHYPLAPTILLIHGFLKIWVASEASFRLVEDQRAGAMELLLSTPLTPERLVRGQWLAFRRQFIGPMILLCVLEWIALAQYFPASVILSVQIVLFADAITLLYLSMWQGLNARSLTQAIFRSCGFILLLPWALHTLVVGPGSVLPRFLGFGRGKFELEESTMVWLIISLANNAFWLFFWARPRLKNNFRDAVLARFTKPRDPAEEPAA